MACPSLSLPAIFTNWSFPLLEEFTLDIQNDDAAPIYYGETFDCMPRVRHVALSTPEFDTDLRDMEFLRLEHLRSLQLRNCSSITSATKFLNWQQKWGKFEKLEIIGTGLLSDVDSNGVRLVKHDSGDKLVWSKH